MNNRPATFDSAVLSYLPRLRKMAKILTDRNKQDDLVQSTIERALKYWHSYNPEKNLGGWLIYQMRNVAFLERRQVVPTSEIDLDIFSTPATQDDDVEMSRLIGVIEASPHADVMRLVASGHSTSEIASIRGGSKQRVHQKIKAFRRAAGVAA